MCIWLHHQQVCVESLIKVQLLVFYQSPLCISSSFNVCVWVCGVWGVFVLMCGWNGKGDDGGGGGGGGGVASYH